MIGGGDRCAIGHFAGEIVALPAFFDRVLILLFETFIEIVARLAPGGEFRFMVYAKNSWKQAMINKNLDQYEAQAGCPYARSFGKEEIAGILGDAFEILRLRQDHCFMYNIDKYKQGEYELEPWFAAMPDAMREAVREYLGWHLLVKARRK